LAMTVTRMKHKLMSSKQHTMNHHTTLARSMRVHA
jgi:hypothetical protein